MASKVVEVPIHEISVEFYVRQNVSQDRVSALKALIEAGVELPPILLNDRYQIIDGRHRFDAYKEAGHVALRCEIRRDLMLGDQIMEALKCNMGGSLPPTVADIRLAIQNMLTAGMKYGAILQGLPLPASVGKRYIKEAQSNMVKQRIRLAITAITESEMSLSAAAAKYNVSIDSLKEELSGKKTKAKDQYAGLGKIKSGISARYTSCSHQNSQMFQRMIESFTDGDLSYENAVEALDHTEKAITSQLNNIGGWRLRLEAARRSVDY